jgi:hypothetical protein
MMSKKEIVRRIRALEAIPRFKRPISIRQLGRISGLSESRNQFFAKTKEALTEDMHDATQAKLSQALTWLENNQLELTRKGREETKVTIQPPKPPCVMRKRFRLTDKGFEVITVAVNPLSFPES